MEPYENDELTATLSSLRPQPRPEFVAELDARAAAGFPRDSHAPGFASAELLDWLRGLKPRQILLPAGATALTAILIATVVVSQNSGGGDAEMLSLNDAPSLERLHANGTPSRGESGDSAGGTGQGSGSGDSTAAAEEESSSGVQYESEVPVAPSASNGSGEKSAEALSDTVRNSGTAGVGRQTRSIERSAEITLGTEPENVGTASSEVFDVVHANRGVVLNSQTTDGTSGRASAEFELLIPSGKLGEAMAGFSEIAEVRSRHEATNDITAPTVSTSEHLEDSQARIDSLLAQLAEAETESEREAVEAELSFERNRASRLRAKLANLDRRASLSRVYLEIQGGEGTSTSDEGGAWGIGDALDDAGRVLAVGAGVALIALAVLGPIALIALLIWLARRTYLRRARHAALG